MNNRLCSILKKHPPRKNICSIMVALVCFVLIITFVCAFAFVAAAVANYVYDARHSIPNPVMRGDDMGAGIVVIFWGLASVVISVPLAVISAKYIFINISILLGCK